MSKTKTYSEKLKDPRWQKKRLKILERWGFKCNDCGTEKRTLHVHHKFYRKNQNPWDYEDHQLCVLCDICHSYRTNITQSIVESIGYLDNQNLYYLNCVLGTITINPNSLKRFYDFITGLESDVLFLAEQENPKEEDVN